MVKMRAFDVIFELHSCASINKEHISYFVRVYSHYNIPVYTHQKESIFNLFYKYFEYNILHSIISILRHMLVVCNIVGFANKGM